MKLLQVVPDTPYMIWQLYVQMLNFRDYGVEKDAVVLVAISVGKKPTKEMWDFKDWTSATVLFYDDTRVSKVYTSSIRPHLLAKYFKEFPSSEAYMYHDQDIIFLKKPDIDKLAEGPLNYVSEEAHNYTGTDYMLKFKKYQFYSFCEMCEIDPDKFIAQRENCGGAQYILKNTTFEFWEYVEKKCEQAYNYFTDITKQGIRQWYPEEELPKHHIQIWATDMYVVLAAMIKFEMEFKWAKEISFCWPSWPAKAGAEKAILHNAGVTHKNEYEKKYKVVSADQTIIIGSGMQEAEAQELQKKHPGSLFQLESEKKVLLNKSHYHLGNYPFGEDHSYVSPDRMQYRYIEYINRFSSDLKTSSMPKRKILAVYNTTNEINKDLLALTLKHLKIAADNATLADVEVVTCSWEPIPNNPFTNAIISPWKNLGHLNYLLQIQLILSRNTGDIVSIHEHDVLYPPDYFDQIISNFDFNSKYGVWNNNYIGMNETGYLEVKNRHQPFSLLAIAKFELENEIPPKIIQCVKNVSAAHSKGWCYVEPDDKSKYVIAPFTNVWPAIHINMNRLSGWHQGKEGKNHHFTNHCEVCYEEVSNGVVHRDDWGDYRKYFTFDLQPAAVPDMPV